jgi:hypothetical protein
MQDKIPQIRPKSVNQASGNSVVVEQENQQVDKEQAKDHKTIDPDKSVQISKISPKTVKKDSKIKSMLKRKYVKVLLILTAILFVILVFFGLAFRDIYRKGMAFYEQTNLLLAAASSKDLADVKSKITSSQEALSDLDKSYKKISFLKLFPFLGNYVKDAGHAIKASRYGLEAGEILIVSIEPYADIIGLTEEGEKATSGKETAEDRIDFIVQTISEILPKVDELEGKLISAKNELDQVDANRYPKSIRGFVLRENIVKGKEKVDMVSDLVQNGKPLLAQATYLLGIEEERNYLIIFQNDKELRPTGGFLTAYSVSKIEDGKFEQVSSNDIYNLDAKYKPVIPAPEPIIDYIKGPYTISKNLRLRDMNWSPDFNESMNLFTEESKDLGFEDIDGIIAVDTYLLVNILEVLGPIGVPGFGDFSTEITPECDCPQVIYELESFADVEGPIVWDPVSKEIVYKPPHSDNRKKIIGPLMNSILANALGQPSEKIPALVEAAYKSVEEKHVLFYMFDQDVQKAVESFGLAKKLNKR